VLTDLRADEPMPRPAAVPTPPSTTDPIYGNGDGDGEAAE
jgi:hypothetical protein